MGYSPGNVKSSAWPSRNRTLQPPGMWLNAGAVLPTMSSMIGMADWTSSGTAFFVQKIAAALVPWTVGIALSRIGYVPDVPQTETALAGIRALYGWGSAAAFLISIIFCYLVPITRQNHAALREAMRLKKEGKPYDTEAFKDIIR